MYKRQDENVRRYAVDTLKKSMTWAKELGAHVVGTETAYPRLNWELRQQWKLFMMDSILRVMEAVSYTHLSGI